MTCFFGGALPSASYLLDSFSSPPQSFVVCVVSAYVVYPLSAVTNKPRNAVREGLSVYSELKVSTGLS